MGGRVGHRSDSFGVKRGREREQARSSTDLLEESEPGQQFGVVAEKDEVPEEKRTQTNR